MDNSLTPHVFLKVLNGIRSPYYLHKTSCSCRNNNVLSCSGFFFFYQLAPSTADTLLTTKFSATVQSSYKTLAMSFKIVSSILSFPWNKFRKLSMESYRKTGCFMDYKFTQTRSNNCMQKSDVPTEVPLHVYNMNHNYLHWLTNLHVEKHVCVCLQ